MALRIEREKTCEMHQVESTDLSQRLIHGEFRTEACKVAVGAFVLALVVGRINSLRLRKVVRSVAAQNQPWS